LPRQNHIDFSIVVVKITKLKKREQNFERRTITQMLGFPPRRLVKKIVEIVYVWKEAVDVQAKHYVKNSLWSQA
jgi:hypothetical protein